MGASLYSACWDFARMSLTSGGATFGGSVTGTVTFPVAAPVDSPGGTNVIYGHVDILSVGKGAPLVDGIYLGLFGPDFVDQTVGALSLAYSDTQNRYLLHNSGGANFTVTWSGDIGTELRDILGFEANLSGANNYTSTKRPKYTIVSRIAGQTDQHAPYKPQGRIQYKEADDGTPFATRPRLIPTYTDWVQPFETQFGPTDAEWLANPFVGGAPTRSRDFVTSAATKVWWSWEDFWEHVWCVLPWRLYDPTLTASGGYLYKFVGPGGNFDPPRTVANFATYWSPKLDTQEVGRWTLA